MSRGSRLDIFAVGLAGLLACAAASTLYYSASQQQLEYSGSADHNAHQYADERAIEAKECVALAPLVRDECKDDAREAARSGQRSEYDLEAQRVTATWTQHMGIAAMIGMAVSIFGVGLIWTTFRETRKGADAARDNLEAFLKGQRAHLAFRSGQLGWMIGPPRINFIVGNDGPSVAEIHTVEWLECDQAVYPDTLEEYDGLQVIVPVGGQGNFLLGVSPLEDNDHFYMIGRIAYRTLTLPDRHSYFCFLVQRITNEAGQQIITERAECANMPKDT